MSRIPVKSIWLNRAEGKIGETGSRTASTFGEASRILRDWARTAPHPGHGYHKIDFRVDWVDGESYKGRYDLKFEDRLNFNHLGSAIQDHLAFLAGLRFPTRYSPEQYESYLAEIGYGPGSENRARAKVVLENYEF